MKSTRNKKHLTYNDRLIIERMVLQGFTKEDIAKAIGCCLRTIYYEINRAVYIHKNPNKKTEVRYNPDGAERKYREMLHSKGATSKLLLDPELINYIKVMIEKYKYSPKAIINTIKKENLKFKVEVKSPNTIYKAIRNGYIEGITLDTLPRNGRNKRRKKRIKIQKRLPAGTSIEKRPEIVLERTILGHWEMDTVKGTQRNKKTLLVLTEMKTRFEIVEVLKSCTKIEVVRALNRIEKRFGSKFYKLFKTITVDNGSEFKDFYGMEKALYRVGKRTLLFCCHPHCPHERGSNENNNHLIRRFFPKSSDFDLTVKKSTVKEVQDWINKYPRDILNGFSAMDIFYKEAKELLDINVSPV